MRVVFSTATFLFNPIKDLSSKKDYVNGILRDEFPKFNYFPLPDDAPCEIPRILANSHHGFSNISISTNILQFATTFNDDFCSSWAEKCSPYIKKKVDLIAPLFDNIFEDMLFCGFTVNAVADTDINSVDVIKQKHLKHSFATNWQLYDVEIKQTFKIENKYYLNIQLQNQRLPINLIEQNYSLISDVEDNNKIGIVIDINDRYSANYNKNYKSSIDTFYNILKISDNVITDKIYNLINNGEFEL